MEEQMMVFFCSFCHKHFNTYNKEVDCKFCDAPHDWYVSSPKHIDEWNNKKRSYSLDEYIDTVNHIRKTGVEFFYPHRNGIKSFEQERTDYPITQLDIIEIIENNMEVLVDSIHGHESDISINEIFSRK